MSSQRHIVRRLATLLAAVFLVFNVGLPIVLASCPMADASRKSLCPMCTTSAKTAGLKLDRVIDRSCCATVIAAGRNTSEFLQSNNDCSGGSLVMFHIVSQNDPILPKIVNSENRLLSSSPPLHDRDILILTSSLLI